MKGFVTVNVAMTLYQHYDGWTPVTDGSRAIKITATSSEHGKMNVNTKCGMVHALIVRTEWSILNSTIQYMQFCEHYHAVVS